MRDPKDAAAELWDSSEREGYLRSVRVSAPRLRIKNCPLNPLNAQFILKNSIPRVVRENDLRVIFRRLHM